MNLIVRYGTFSMTPRSRLDLCHTHLLEVCSITRATVSSQASTQNWHCRRHRINALTASLYIICATAGHMCWIVAFLSWCALTARQGAYETFTHCINIVTKSRRSKFAKASLVHDALDSQSMVLFFYCSADKLKLALHWGDHYCHASLQYLYVLRPESRFFIFQRLLFTQVDCRHLRSYIFYHSPNRHWCLRKNHDCWPCRLCIASIHGNVVLILLQIMLWCLKWASKWYEAWNGLSYNHISFPLISVYDCLQSGPKFAGWDQSTGSHAENGESSHSMVATLVGRQISTIASVCGPCCEKSTALSR